MNRRRAAYVALLTAFPAVTYLGVYLSFQDSYIAIVASYIALLLVIEFAAPLDEFLRFPDLQVAWVRESESVKWIVFDEGEFQGFDRRAEPGQRPLVIIGAKPTVFVNKPDIHNTGKRKYALEETGAVIRRMRDDVMWYIFLNIFILFALMMIGRNIAGTPSSPDEAIWTQRRLAISYFAVVLQLVWIGRIAFHYRQKNADNLNIT